MLERSAADPDQAIDFVVLWVDGNDPVLAEKRNRYMEEEGLSSGHTAALPTRFASSHEIRYCILSILRFAPFARKIFLVTDGQDPHLDEDMDRYFPDRKTEVRIVDHSEIFRGHENLLPIFNSTSISSMIWRIEDLAEQFIYINDDNFLLRPTSAEDWFREGRPVLRGSWRNPPWKKAFSHRLKRFLKHSVLQKKDYQPRLSFYLRQWNGAREAGFRKKYFFHDHSPHPLSRTSLERFFAEHKATLLGNASYRFRAPEQFLISALVYHLELREGNGNLRPLELLYLHPVYSPSKLQRKLDAARSDDSILFACVQSLEMMEESFREEVFGWMKEVLELDEER